MSELSISSLMDYLDYIERWPCPECDGAASQRCEFLGPTGVDSCIVGCDVCGGSGIDPKAPQWEGD